MSNEQALADRIIELEQENLKLKDRLVEAVSAFEYIVDGFRENPDLDLLEWSIARVLDLKDRSIEEKTFQK